MSLGWLSTTQMSRDAQSWSHRDYCPRRSTSCRVNCTASACSPTLRRFVCRGVVNTVCVVNRSLEAVRQVPELLRMTRGAEESNSGPSSNHHHDFTVTIFGTDSAT